MVAFRSRTLENHCHSRSLTVTHALSGPFRLSTVKNADVVAVIDGGVVVEQGTHDSLLAREKSVYRALVERQLETTDGAPTVDMAVGKTAASAGRRPPAAAAAAAGTVAAAAGGADAKADPAEVAVRVGTYAPAGGNTGGGNGASPHYYRTTAINCSQSTLRP